MIRPHAESSPTSGRQNLMTDLASAKARVDKARELVARIKRANSFDRLNSVTTGLRLDDFEAIERSQIEAAIDARRQYLTKLAWTL